MGKPTALYRVRKQKAESDGTKLGRPFRITQKTLGEMCKGKNPVRWKPLAIQRRYWEISNSVRPLKENLRTRKKRASMYVDTRRGVIRDYNKDY